jgi:hypothetical protein
VDRLVLVILVLIRDDLLVQATGEVVVELVLAVLESPRRSRDPIVVLRGFEELV